MPSMLNRVYLRSTAAIGTREKIVGLLILLVAIAIVVGFVRQFNSTAKPLFSVDESAYRSAESDDLAAAATQILPDLGDRQWAAGSEADVIPQESWETKRPELAASLQAFDARIAFGREYETSGKPAVRVTATVCDTGSAAQAFGLCLSRRNSQADTLNTGRNGWVAPDWSAAGFWNGRYYTELATSGHSDDAQKAIKAVAAALDERQLDYGLPLSAELLLPSEGRLVDSFRYVHKDALGMDPLDGAFLVDLDGGVTAFVIDRRTPAGAQALLEEIKAYKPKPKQDASGYEQYGLEQEEESAKIRYSGPVTIVPVGDRNLALFTAGTHVHGTLGSDFETVVTIAKARYETAMPPAGTAVAVGKPAGSSDQSKSPFPANAADGWSAPTNISAFTADNLYVKIDGRADLYIQFGVVSLTYGSYASESDGGRTIDVYWYDMGKPANALGIYQAELSPDTEPLDFAGQGYKAGGAVFFIKAGHYLQVLPTGFEADDAEAAYAIAKSIYDSIEESGEQMWAEKILPKKDQVAGSLAFLNRDVFSLDFLHDVYTADYEVDGQTYKLFVHRADDEQAVSELMEKYKEFFGQYGKVTWSDPDSSRSIISGDVFGYIDVVFSKGRYLGGVSGAENGETAKRLAVEFYDGLDVSD